MSPLVYYIFHVASLLALTGGIFYGFAGAPGTRKKVMIITGISSLLVLGSGFGLLATVHANQFHTWVIVKLVAWLALSALAGIGYRKRDQAIVRSKSTSSWDTTSTGRLTSVWHQTSDSRQCDGEFRGTR